MKIGLISDSHDNLYNLKKSVTLFNALGVEHVLHAGDMISPFSARILNELKCPWTGVFGNNDGEEEGLEKVSGGKIKKPPVEVSIGGKRFCLTHDKKSLPPVVAADVVVFGHTHEKEVFKKEGVLFVNPGESGGHLTNFPTIAVIDTGSLDVEFLDLLCSY